MNRIILNETSYHGAGAISAIVDEAKNRGFAKALVCSDPALITFGVTAKVTDLLDGAGLAYEIFSDIKPNPTIENVQAGVAAFKAAGADYLIAIGGGSSMDTAKAVGIIITNPEFADVRSLEGVGCRALVCPYQTGDSELDTPEISDNHHEYVAQPGRIYLPEYGPPCRTGRLAIVICPPHISLQAYAVGIAMMARVVVLLLEGSPDLLDFSFALHRICQSDEAASVVFEKSFGSFLYATICII